MSRENACRYCHEEFPSSLGLSEHKCPRKQEKTYLGDGVFCSFDGIHLVLTTDKDLPAPSRIIYLGVSEFRALCDSAEINWGIAIATFQKGRK